MPKFPRPERWPERELPEYQLRIEGLTLLVDSLSGKPPKEEAKEVIRAVNNALVKLPGCPLLGGRRKRVTREPMPVE